MGEFVNLHASCVRLAEAAGRFDADPDAGVLLIGRSGAGKSDLALRLIARGAELVADDRTLLSIEDGCLVAQAPEAIAGLLEVRDLGLIRLPHAERVRIALAVDLDGERRRLPERLEFLPPGLPAAPIPLVRLNAMEPSAPEKTILAVAAYCQGRLHAP